MSIPWTAKRQILYFLVFALIFAVGIGFLLYSIIKPTCSDGRKNQGEQGIDCGGPCKECIGEVKDTIIVWSKLFEIKNGLFDATALIENPNIFLGTKSIKYKFKMYDDKNILVAVREGMTFINPRDQFVIFEPNIKSNLKKPKRIFFELEKESAKWEIIRENAPEIIIAGKNFVLTPTPYLSAVIKNESLSDVKNISATVVLSDSQGTVVGVSSTQIDKIGGRQSAEIKFSWPEDYKFSSEPVESRIYLRTDLTKEI